MRITQRELAALRDKFTAPGHKQQSAPAIGPERHCAQGEYGEKLRPLPNDWSRRVDQLLPRIADVGIRRLLSSTRNLRFVTPAYYEQLMTVRRLYLAPLD